MARPKNTYNFADLLDEKFSVIKLEQTGPGAEIEITTGGHDYIGEGTYGTVFKVEYNGATCVARELHPDLTLRRAKSCEEQYLSNCQRCVNLRHPNIIQFFGVCNNKTNNPPLQVMEKMDCSLNSYIQSSTLPMSTVKISFSTKLSILRDVAAGLMYLHCRKPRPIVHCYLSSNNVLLTTAIQAKISDVGLAQMVKGDKSSSKAKMFMAPEMTSKSQSVNTSVDPSADVFSYGAVMLHTITQQWPECLSVPSISHNDLDDVMASCLVDTPRNRPSITDVLTKLKAIMSTVTSDVDEHKLEQLQNLEQSNVTPQKQDELTKKLDEQKKNDKQDSLRSHSHQGQHKKKANTNNQLEQEDRKDVMDQQQSNSDDQHIQDDSKTLAEHANVQQNISTSNTSRRFDEHGPKVVDGKESNYIKRKTDEFPGENERSAEKESSATSAQLIQKDVKGNDDVPVKENFEQFNAMQQKQDELNNEQKDEKQYSKSSKSKSQKSQHKQQKKKADNNSQDNDLLCHSNSNINNQLEQEDGKDDIMDQLQSNKDYQHAQDDSKKTNDSGSDIIKKRSSQAKKVQHSTSTDGTTPFKFDSLGPKVIGFYNQGNTCFFNAMLQSIHQTVGLHYAISVGKRLYTINSTKGPLTVEVTKSSGQLTKQLQNLFCEISKGSGPISLHNLLHTIGKRNSHFGHGTQEDSHEVLRCLLSALRDEELDLIKQEILSRHSIKGNFLTDECVDGETKLYMKECLSKVSKGICNVDSVFGSFLISTTVCHACETPLQTTEFHFDLSLPVPEHMFHDKPCAHSGASSQPLKRKRGKNKRGQRATKSNATTTQTQAQASLPEESSSVIPDVVKSQRHFTLHLQKNSLSHCSFLDTKDLKLETQLEHCLLAFTSLDTLDENNMFICQSCSDRKSKIELCCVSKQILIHKLSPVLILHIKRFIIGRHRITKDNRNISFPHVLDMAPFCTNECVENLADMDKRILYGLYAVVEHSGSLHDGHYATYVKRRRPIWQPKDDQSLMKCSMQSSDVTLKRKYNQKAAEEGEWYYANDSYISKCSFGSVLHCQPYLLFYEMLPYM